MALTEKEKQLLKNVLAKYPQPETFDINEVKNPESKVLVKEAVPSAA